MFFAKLCRNWLDQISPPKRWLFDPVNYGGALKSTPVCLSLVSFQKKDNTWKNVHLRTQRNRPHWKLSSQKSFWIVSTPSVVHTTYIILLLLLLLLVSKAYDSIWKTRVCVRILTFEKLSSIIRTVYHDCPGFRSNVGFIALWRCLTTVSDAYSLRKVQHVLYSTLGASGKWEGVWDGYFSVACTA